MKKKRFSVEQIVAVLKQAELGMPVAELTHQVGISQQTFYRGKKHPLGLEPGTRGYEWTNCVICNPNTNMTDSRLASH